MSVSKSLFGTTRIIPETNETGWGAEMTGVVEDLIDHADISSVQIGTQVVPKEGSTSTALAAGSTLTQTHQTHKVAGSGGAVTLSAVTAIADGTTAGQILNLEGTSDVNTVTIQDNANTRMNGDVTLMDNERITFVWDGTDWIEDRRST